MDQPGVGVSDLVRAELNRHPWDALRCGCGESAEHVPMIFDAIIEAEAPRDMIGYTLDDHLELGTNLFEASVPGVGVLSIAPAPPYGCQDEASTCSLTSMILTAE